MKHVFKVFVVTLLLVVLVSGMAMAAKVKLRMATPYYEGSAIVSAAHKFVALVQEKSDGEIEINLYTGGAMGADREITEQLSAGTLDIKLSGPIELSMYVPQHAFLDSPYIMTSREHWSNVWNNSPIGDRIKGEVEKKAGLKYIGWMYRGARYLTANKPIKSPEDARGVKLRLPEEISWMNAWAALGTLNTPIALSELFTSLRLGVAEASEGPFDQIVSYHLEEVQDYLMLTEHMYSSAQMIINDARFNSLSEEYRGVILEAAAEACEYGTKLSEDTESILLKELEEKGMTVVEVDKEAFCEAARPGIEKNFKKLFKDYTWDDILEYSPEVNPDLK